MAVRIARVTSQRRPVMRHAFSALADGDLPRGPCAHPAGHTTAGVRGRQGLNVGEESKRWTLLIQKPFCSAGAKGGRRRAV
jgi:hypothetical protein